jgi:fatty acid amide hydrolase
VKRLRGESLGPLAGVPATIKECIDVAGSPSTFGLAWRKDHCAATDEVHVARLKAAGAIIVGKTNVAQLLAYIESDNPVYGRTNNPWSPERVCGGSSGGEGAIIAAGASPLGLGTDIGGSARYPAAFCGTASMKPTAGRCDDPGIYSFHPGQRAIVSQVGVLARNVDDVALGLNVINGGPELANWRSVDIAGLRVGYYVEDGIFRSSPAIRRSVREAAQALKDAGAQIVEWQPHDTARAFRVAYGLLGGDELRCFREALRGGPAHPSVKTMLSIAGKPRGLLNVGAKLLNAVGQKTLARMLPLFAHADVYDYWQLVVEQMDYRVRFAEAMDRADGGPLDVILGPVCALPAFRHGSTKDLGVAGVNTMLYNLLGYPAGVVPWSRVGEDEESDRPASGDIVEKVAKKCEEGSAGLPTAVQLAARPWREHVAFAAMQVVEDAARRRSDCPQRPEL